MVIHMYIPETDRDDGGILKGITCFALDMDGTVYLGEKWIEGARDFLCLLLQDKRCPPRPDQWGHRSNPRNT